MIYFQGVIVFHTNPFHRICLNSKVLAFRLIIKADRNNTIRDPASRGSGHRMPARYWGQPSRGDTQTIQADEGGRPRPYRHHDGQRLATHAARFRPQLHAQGPFSHRRGHRCRADLSMILPYRQALPRPPDGSPHS